MIDLHIVVTCADLENHKLSENRRNEYLKTLEWLNSNASRYKITWVECVKNENSFIEKYTPVFYTKVHDKNYANKGSDWGQSIKKFLTECDYSAEYTMHLTGRYHFIDGYFFSMIEENPEYDLYVKRPKNSQYKTGCFCMRTEKLRDWICNTDWNMLNSKMINVEASIWDYVKSNNLRVCELDTLNMEWNIFGTGNPQKVLV